LFELRLQKWEPKPTEKTGKKAGVAEVVIVAHFEGGEVLLEAGS